MNQSGKLAAEVSLLEVFQIVLRRRWTVLWITLAFATAGVVAAFLWPKTYEATATVFPVSSTRASSLSQYAGLASLAGVELPIGNGSSGDPSKTVIALLGSRVLVEALVSNMNLVERLNEPQLVKKFVGEPRRLFDETVRSLQSRVSHRKDKDTGVISVSVELRDPQLAQEVTNRLIELLDDLLVEKSLTTARKKTESLNRQIEEQKLKVDSLQQEMAKFQKDTDLLDPKTQAGQAMEAYTAMIQQKMGLELQLATAQASYSSDNPRINLLQSQLDNLDGQIQRVKTQVGGELPSLKAAPENLIRYQNLARDLEIATRIYAGLLAGLEQAKLEDDQDQVYVEVLDKALLPRLGKPSRFMIVAVAVVVGFLGSVLLLLANVVFKNDMLLAGFWTHRAYGTER